GPRPDVFALVRLHFLLVRDSHLAPAVVREAFSHQRFRGAGVPSAFSRLEACTTTGTEITDYRSVLPRKPLGPTRRRRRRWARGGACRLPAPLRAGVGRGRRAAIDSRSTRLTASPDAGCVRGRSGRRPRPTRRRSFHETPGPTRREPGSRGCQRGSRVA